MADNPHVTLNLFQGPIIQLAQVLAVRRMLKQVQHDDLGAEVA
jgi:hypothetical protein